MVLVVERWDGNNNLVYGTFCTGFASQGPLKAGEEIRRKTELGCEELITRISSAGTRDGRQVMFLVVERWVAQGLLRITLASKMALCNSLKLSRTPC